MEIGVKVFAENYKEEKRLHTNSAYLTFVCVNKEGKPVKAIESIPESEDEKRRFEDALRRRDSRLENRNNQH
jgi:acyl-CoA hydrolase